MAELLAFVFFLWLIAHIVLPALQGVLNDLKPIISLISRWSGIWYVHDIGYVPRLYWGISTVALSSKDGLEQEVEIPKQFFPALVANDLKGKKHEWLVVGVAKEGVIFKCYSHKGDSRESVHGLPPSGIALYAKKTKADAVIILHNHPNGVLQASEQDIKSARELNKFLKPINVSLTEFVCATGSFRLYH